MSGWIKLHRKFLNWEWYTKDNMAHFFLHLLLMANHKETKWRGVVVGRGQLLTGRKQLSESTGLSERSVRTCLNLLKSTNELTIKTTSKYSVITIINYDLYQDNDDESTSKTTSKQSGDRPSTDQVPTTSKNEKNNKNEKKEEVALSFSLRVLDFQREVFEYAKTKLIPDKVAEDFFNYWSEATTGKVKKMLWETMKTFSLPKRFGTWMKKEKEYRYKPGEKLTRQEQILKSIEENELSRQTGTYAD